MEWTRHVELHQLWISHVLTGHGQYIKENSTAHSAPLRSILKSTIKWQKDLAKLYALFAILNSFDLFH